MSPMLSQGKRNKSIKTHCSDMFHLFYFPPLSIGLPFTGGRGGGKKIWNLPTKLTVTHPLLLFMEFRTLLWMWKCGSFCWMNEWPLWFYCNFDLFYSLTQLQIIDLFCCPMQCKREFIRHLHLMWAQSAQYSQQSIIYTTQNTMNRNTDGYINMLQCFIQQCSHHFRPKHTKPTPHDCTRPGKAFRVPRKKMGLEGRFKQCRGRRVLERAE